jgi:hypothetical protein
MTTTVEKVLYAAKTHTTGGRDGASRSSDGAWTSTLCRPAGPATVPILSNSSAPLVGVLPARVYSPMLLALDRCGCVALSQCALAWRVSN